MYPARPIRTMRTPPIFLAPIITAGSSRPSTSKSSLRQRAIVMSKKSPPKGLPTERTWRSLIRGIAKVLRTNQELTVKDRLELSRLIVLEVFLAFDLDDAEYEISYLKREINELRENLAKMWRRLDNIEPKANRTYSFLWDKIATMNRSAR
jgi:hypothetical protein